MTQRPPMACDACHELLADVVCGELPHETERSVRAHASGCGRCGPQLQLLSRVMRLAQDVPLEEPSPGFEDRILRAAKDALRGRPVRPVAEGPGRVARIRRWLARAGAWAMSPQVAMASLLVLMVGIGLFALPLGQDAEPAALRPADDGRPPAATSATATAAPQRDEAAEDEEAPLEEARPGEEGVAASTSPASPAPSADRAARRRSERPAVREKAEAKRARAGRAEKPRGKALNLDQGFAPPPPAVAGAGAERGAAVAAEPRPADSRAADGVDEESSALRGGMTLVKQGHHRDAIALLTPMLQSRNPLHRSQARLWLARAYRGLGDCRKALSFYAPIVRSSSASKATLEEAADCYARTGEPTQAEALRTRAAAR